MWTSKIPGLYMHTLVTMDVTSLYTNIPWEERVNLVVQEFAITEPTVDPALLRELLNYILHNNFFSYNDKFYRQTFGTAMGARMAVKYANIYMGVKWLSTLKYTTHKPYHDTPDSNSNQSDSRLVTCGTWEGEHPRSKRNTDP